MAILVTGLVRVSLLWLATQKMVKAMRNLALSLLSPLKIGGGLPLRAPFPPAGGFPPCPVVPSLPPLPPPPPPPPLLPPVLLVLWAGAWVSWVAIWTGCDMMTADVDAMGSMSVGMFSPKLAALSITGRTWWVGESCAWGP